MKKLPLYSFSFLLLLLAGCSSSAHMGGGWGREYEPSSLTQNGVDGRPNGIAESPAVTSGEESSPSEDVQAPGDVSTRLNQPNSTRMVEQALRQELDRWMGVPYVLGGTTMRGVDCSALVQNVFAEALSVQTPRTTSGLVRLGKKVNTRELLPGDLVFFEPGNNYKHVGIFLGDGTFAHASSSRGVMISDLSEAYWSRSYTTSRRILYSEGGPRVAEAKIQESRQDTFVPHW